MLIGLAIVIGAFAVTGTTAIAEFGITSKTGFAKTGKIEVIKSGEFNFTLGEHSYKTTCIGPGITGLWEIRSTGKLLELSKGPGQQLTKRGANLIVQITDWGESCKAIFKPCSFQFHSESTKLVNIKFAIATECVIKIPNCSIHMLPGEPTKNFNLSKIQGENTKESLELTTMVSGIAAKIVEETTCDPLGPTETGELVGMQLRAVGVNIV